jgi:proteasome lid subunit RPN8/RPN11
MNAAFHTYLRIATMSNDTLEIHFRHPRNSSSLIADLSPDCTGAQALEALVQEVNGFIQPLPPARWYELVISRTGNVIPPNMTFQEAGVVHGDVIDIVLPVEGASVKMFRSKHKTGATLLWRNRPPQDPRFFCFASLASSFEVYFQHDVLQNALEHCQRALPKETIGLLAGRPCQDARGAFTVVTGIEAASAAEIQSTPSEVHLSGQGYANLRGRLEMNYPVLEVVGWFHSHPLSAPILSSEDLVEQSTWTDDNAVALVVSLMSQVKRFGVFHGSDGIPLFEGLSVFSRAKAAVKV